MKKNGFTLAEVLITLAIIGVVATMTLPALMTNTQEQQAKTGMKKGLNTLTEAAQMNAAISGFDYASLSSTDIDDNAASLYGMLSNRTSVDYKLSGSNTDAAKAVNNGASNYVVFFRDGSAISFDKDNSMSSGTTGAEIANKKMEDGLTYGIAVLYDTNGAKAPNLLSNCNGDSALTGASEGIKDTSSEDCSAKAKRVIKDQFAVRLRDGFAVPNSAAARWAYDN